MMPARAKSTATRTELDEVNPAVTSGYDVAGRYVVSDLAGRVSAAVKSRRRPDLLDNVSLIETDRDELPFESRITAAVKVQVTPAGFKPTYVTLQEWEGCVERVDGETVFARLRDITRGARELSDLAEIPLEEISPDDVERLAPGSLFRWAIGYRRTAGVQERFSRIVVRHLPAWTQKEIAEAESFSKKYRGLFQRPDNWRDWKPRKRKAQEGGGLLGVLSRAWEEPLTGADWKKLMEHAKDRWGKLTDNDLKIIAGRRDQLEGKLRERYGLAEDQVHKDVDDWVKSLK
jgi:uncharacterized protein YjbJ (UPF0337 family)